MSAFNARSAMKAIELLLWFLVWFGEEFGMQIVEVIWSKIVRSSRTFRGRTGSVYISQLVRLKCWKAAIDRLKLLLRTDRQTATPGTLDRQIATLEYEHLEFQARQIATLEGL